MTDLTTEEKERARVIADDTSMLRESGPVRDEARRLLARLVTRIEELEASAAADLKKIEDGIEADVAKFRGKAK